MKRGGKAFTLVEIMIVVAIIGLLAAKQQWALEQGQVGTSIPQGTDIQPYLGRASGTLPTCPIDPQNSFGTSYTMGNCETPPVCLILPARHVLPP